MKYYNKSFRDGQFINIGTKSLLLAVAFFIISGLMFMVQKVLACSPILSDLLSKVSQTIGFGGWMAFGCGAAFLVGASILYVAFPKNFYIAWLVRRALLSPQRGNPLNLKNGDLLPHISCHGKTPKYYLKIRTEGFNPDDIKKLSPVISSALTGRAQSFTVTAVFEDEARNSVTFVIEDVMQNHQYHFRDFQQFTDVCRTLPPTKLFIQKGVGIDLTTAGSMLLVGKTRSGKTTGAVVLLLQALVRGSDIYNSVVLIIDPKKAELNRLPHVVTLDEDGGGRAILNALRVFAESIKKRQNILNTLSEVDGNAVYWWEAGFHPSLLFLDEFVILRTLFPKRPEKENPEYCLATFDDILKTIVTTGASAGCFVIGSIAEASVGEGGLSSMLQAAMGTKILFRPTIREGRFLWDTEKLTNMIERKYKPGEAWYSSTDGEHDNTVSFVRFPQMDFPIYRELRRLLTEYYEG